MTIADLDYFQQKIADGSLREATLWCRNGHLGSSSPFAAAAVRQAVSG
jgi:hypothetical protein